MMDTPPDPPHLDLMKCLDCSSSTEVEHVDGEVRVWLRHSTSCLVWTHAARQLALLVCDDPAVEDDQSRAQDPA